MSRPKQASYKRSWRNYLLDAHYQLRFTLIMVGLAGILLVGLGYWVAWRTGKTTQIAIDQLDASAADYATKVGLLEREQLIILIALIVVGALLLGALFVYGIVATHKVAGPLFKIGLHLDKIRDGRYDPVYNLRKGDQLVSFFDHFRAAHGALRKVQEDDLVALRAFVASAEGKPELAALVGEVKTLVASKEAGLG